MYIANATGCSSIWGASAPSFPYTAGKDGKGPAWASSLFEDNGEFGLGMLTADRIIHERAIKAIEKLGNASEDSFTVETVENFLKNGNEENRQKLLRLAEAMDSNPAKEILKYKDFMTEKSHWIFGGDGWAYDIGFGGLDHVIASGENINIFVFDTEIYSNTGGQASKATPLGASAKLSLGGKTGAKKNLGAMAMTYGNVYVAQVAMGADFNQCLKAIIGAEAYKGPSLIIGYAPCISHGIKKGMSFCMQEQKRAVECGFWQLFRFDPDRKNKGQNPLVIDSKAPEPEKYREFLLGEQRFREVLKDNPESKGIFQRSQEEMLKKYELLKKLSQL
jgi:pyruvate-ferredoxin/flavodoxin oxidoreductase